jgi:hypothetical protein
MVTAVWSFDHWTTKLCGIISIAMLINIASSFRQVAVRHQRAGRFFGFLCVIWFISTFTFFDGCRAFLAPVKLTALMK